MTPERYQRLCELFDQAQAHPPDRRATFLQQVGDVDPALRAELESMLADDQKARGELLLQQPCPVNARALLPGEQPTVRNAPTAAEPHEAGDALVGRQVGPYLIEAPIGHGGMGSVYRALRMGDYRQRVALKVIRPGLGSDEMLRRFRTERQVLAELAHPHIARLLDGGSTDDGRPYFVMEYIDGLPLDRYCAGRQLGTRERVELLRSVCAAVQYAHERGVLHRDLKPDNVLVTADGTPKVTDFGLAKRLEGGSGHTASGAILGTPSYMAPEQAGYKAGAGTPAVGPATDVYALGAILYELLTGRPPFLAETPLETLRQVLTEEAVPPRRLHLKLARDLETICLKCLQKDPGKRYPSARELDDDLQRFLAGQPIHARSVGRVARLGRWARRRPAVASLLAASLLLLALGLAGVTWQWRRAEGQRDRAEQSFRDARAAVDEMLTQVGQERLKDIPEMEPVRQVLLQKALAFYQKFLDERGEDASVRQETARAYRRVGDIQELLGHSREAEDAYRRALALQGRLIAEARGDPERRRELAVTHYQLGALYRNLGRTPDAEVEWQAALALAEELVAEQPARPAYREQLAWAHNGLGIVYKDTNRKDLAETALTQARDLWAGLAQADGAERDYQRQLAVSYNSLSVLYAELGREDDAAAAIDQAIDAQQKLVGGDRTDTEDQRALGALYFTRGWVNYTHGRPGPSEADYRAALPIREELVQRRPGVPRYLFEYVWTLNNLGLLYSTTEQWEKAAEPYQKALPLVERLNHDHPEVAQYEAFHAFSLHGLGWVYLNTGRLDEAEKVYKKALPIRRKVAREHGDIPDHKKYLAELLSQMGVLRERTDKLAEAVTLHGEARAIREELCQRYPRVIQYKEDLAWTYYNLGVAQRKLGRRPEAEEAYEKALLLWKRLMDEHPRQPRYAVRVAAVHATWGDLLLNFGDPQAALDRYGLALAIVDPLHRQSPDFVEAAKELRDASWGRALALGRLGRHREALADWDRALPLANGQTREQLRFQRAPTLAALGDHAGATADVEAAIKDAASPSGEVLFEAARVYALSASSAGADAKLAQVERAALAERYGARAADLLGRAEKADYFQGDGRRDLLQKDKAFDPLRSREDFKQLLDRVAQRAKAGSR
jgi:tetratricopeptide (TPR) repeat protein